MVARLCHALECAQRSLADTCFCAAHWRQLPPKVRERGERQLAAVGQERRSSGSYASAVILAVRWLAVEERRMPGPHPQLDG